MTTTVNNLAGRCIHQLFEAQVARTPQAIALVKETQSVTYQTLNQTANQLAHHLQKLGVQPDVLVGLCVDRSVEMMIGLFGILKAGGAYVPLDPSYPAERLTYMVQDAQVSVILTQHHLVELLPATNAKIICLDRDWNHLEGESQENPISEVKPDHLAYVIYTSGSTGKPKGVMIEHRSLVNFVAVEIETWKISSCDRVLQFVSLSFDVFAKDIYPALIAGGTVLLRTQEMLNSVSTFVQKCQEWKVTIITLPTAFWHQVITELARTGESLPASLRLMFMGGERAIPKKVELWHEYAQSMVQYHNLQVPPQLINCYGPTETTIVATYCNLSDEQSQRLLPTVLIGKPIANTQIYILDPELKVVESGAKGELYIGGISLARGYLNRPELTAEKFIPNPSNLSERLYKTGDAARYLPDGSLEFINRIDDQVKIRGFRIELAEIEVVLEQHPTIGQAVVLVRGDGQENRRLVAYAVPRFSADAQTTQALVTDLRRFLQSKLPDYMQPVTITILKELPLTPNEKVDRQALAALTTGCDRSLETPLIPPQTPEEIMLAHLWADVLGLEQVGIHDNFFELGGDSLKSMVLLNRLQSQVNKSFSAIDLVNAPTIAEFVVCLEKSPALSEFLAGITSHAKNSEVETNYFPSTFLQERFWSYRHLGSFYHTPNYFQLTGALDVSILRQSLNEIIRRHAILRTTLQEVDGKLMQVVAPVATVQMSVVELQTLPQKEQSLAVERSLNEEIQRPVALEKDPWLRVTLLCLGEHSHILLIALHQLVADEQSTELFLRELGVLYAAFLAGESSPLPELPIQYGDYATWQRQSLTPEVLAARLDYWTQWLSQEPAPLALPIARSLSAGTGQAETLKYQLSPTLSQLLKTFSKAYQVTLFTTVLTAFAILLGQWCDCEDLVIAAPATNRNQPQFESLIGDFGRLLVLRICLQGNPSFLELLRRVRQETVAAIANQDVPLEQVANILQPTLRRTKPFSRVYLDFLLEAPRDDLQLSGLTVASVPIEASVMRMDLGAIVWEQQTASGICIEVWWRYKKELFAPEAIAQIATAFQTLLEAMVNNSQQSIQELPLRDILNWVLPVD